MVSTRIHTTITHFICAAGSAALLATAFARSGVTLFAQTAEQRGQLIESMQEPGDGLRILQRSADSFPTFAVAADRGILLDASAAAPAFDRARRFIELYGAEFGLTDPSQVRLKRAERADAVGVEHVRLQQLHQGVAVTAGEWIVHVKGVRVVGTNGRLLHDLPDDVVPSILPDAARVAAATALGKEQGGGLLDAQYSEPRLELFNRGMLEEGTHPTRLAWFIEATGPSLREFIWVDAKTGGMLLHFSQLPYGLNRSVYDTNHTNILPGTLLRTEGQPPTGIVDADLAYDYAGDTYAYYFTQHGRDSYNNLGAPLISTIRYCDPSGGCPMQNAFWNGTQMVYGDGFASGDDVVAHELTHAVTEFSAGLFYFQQSGALNESFSDIFGESVDQTNGHGNDTAGVRWLMGEDLSIGAIRNMMNPGAFGDPGRMNDGLLVCSQDVDGGGVHSNSGIPNHAYALMVDGGTFNGQTITGIGIAKAGAIQYRALTTYLTSGSNFIDNAVALGQSCTDLVGSRGITAADCSQVTKAIAAVEMASRWACAGAVAAPALCPVGQSPNDLFNDNFERTTAGSWAPQTLAAANAWTPTPDTGWAKSGTRMAYGADLNSSSDSALAMTASIALPAGAQLQFNHAFSFEPGFDGGVVRYSTNGGASWTDAGSLFSAGMPYQTSLISGTGNPLGGRLGFGSNSFGYTATQLNLAALAGTNARFRFRIGSDVSVGDIGWVVDDVRVYTCVTCAISLDRTSLAIGSRGGAASIGVSANSVSCPWTAISSVPWIVVTSGSGASGSGAVALAIAPNTSRVPRTGTVTVAGQAVTVAQAGVSVGSGDFDGDGKADIAVFRPSTGTWYIINSSTASGVAQTWGGFGDIPVTGDYDGDGKADIAVFRPSTGGWYIIKSSTASGLAYTWGGFGDIPVPGDYDGDGKTDIAVFRPSTGTWYIIKSSTASGVAQTWGGGGDIPVPGDYDGDGKTDIAVFRPSTGTWYIIKSSTASGLAYTWGGGADIPVARDYDGDGKTDIAVFRPSTGTWYIINSSTMSGLALTWGGGGDIPVPGDYDGDGKADIAVFRPSTGTWYIINSSTMSGLALTWGGGGDIPILMRP